MKIHRVLILNGPNLNLLGERETGTYGHGTLKNLQTLCETTAKTLGLNIDFRQSNHEGELIDWIHECRQNFDAIILNAGAYTHTSVALHDALRAVQKPVIEVHLSNIFAREPFRHHSYISPLARGVICGLGPHGYRLALEALAELPEQP